MDRIMRASPQHDLPVIKDGCLAGCDVPLRVVEPDMSPVPFQRRDLAPGLFGGIAGLHFGAECGCWRFSAYPVHIRSGTFKLPQFIRRTNDQRVRGDVLFQNIERHRRSNTKPLALADGVIGQPLV